MIYTLAFGTKGWEDIKSCSWFLAKLRDYVDIILKLAIIVYQHVGIIVAVVDVFLDTYHSYCYHNLKTDMERTLKRKRKLRGCIVKLPRHLDC